MKLNDFGEPKLPGLPPLKEEADGCYIKARSKKKRPKKGEISPYRARINKNIENGLYR